MKRFFFIPLIMLLSVSITAQVHIKADDPATWSAQELSQYIGQTVVFDNPIVVCSNAGSDLTVGPWRAFQPESHGYTNTEDYKSTVRINGSCIFRLSGIDEYHRCGEKIYNLTATVNSALSLTYVSGEWRGNTRAEMEADIPDLGDYRLLVCGFNLENYFSTLGQMGARSAADKEKQRTKISKALKCIDADIFGLVELQQGNDAVQEIVNDLNTNLPGRNYQFFSDQEIGTSQKVEFVYDANKVEPIGVPGKIDTELKYRKKMVCFREIATGERFIYSINHFKAMNTGDETRRVNEAKAVLDYYNSYRMRKNVRDNDLLLMGDLNCYAFTAPIKIFTNAGLTDLHRAFHADSSYSYMYSGLASYIDHAICTSSLYRQVTGMAAYHINSDENDRYTYDKSNDLSMFRCSDHDPVLVGLKLDSTISGTPYFNGSNYGTDSLTFCYSYIKGEEDVNPLVYFDIYTMYGYRICEPTPIKFNQLNIENHVKYYTLSDDNPDLPEEIKNFLPLPSGVYVIHIYYNNAVYNLKLIIK